LMIAPLAKFIDWSAFQVACALCLRTVPESKWKLEEALEFLNGPDFISAGSDPAQMEFAGPRHFKFASPRPGEDEKNNIVYGRLHRCEGRWQERPVIILLDGSPAVGYHTAFPWLARRFNRAGFNVATPVAPYHLKRRPRRPMEWNCLELARAMAQGVAEIRALTGWLLEEGCPSVGLLGVSFGGWLAGLTACADARIACAVLTVPAVRMTRFCPPVFWRRVFKALRPAHEAMDTTRLNLIVSKPIIPAENILLIEGIHDLFAEAQPIEELWQKWQQPEIWRLPHGHLSWMFTPGLTGRVLRWLAPRLRTQPDTPPEPPPAAP
ncbi:MAG TPA: alpha/beta hydrolase family protein, partial [Verrucomicrobiales bacterium]|nr:alpha/beta hydrolase family protein [Verrucomicrobiales bacterium]